MKDALITIDVKVDAEIFRRFAVFDLLHVKRAWRSPLLFALIMTAFAAVCFAVKDREGSLLLGSVLLTIGLGLPAFYLSAFARSIRSQIKAYGLAKPRGVYTLRFSKAPDGIQAEDPKGDSARYEWGQVYGAFRVKGCVYLYVTVGKAYLLPDTQAQGGNLWQLITQMLPANKIHDKRKKALN